MFVRLVLVVSMILIACHTWAEEKPVDTAKQVLRAGRWTYRGPKTVVQSGRDTTIVLAQEAKGEAWQMSIRHVDYFSINEQKEPMVTELGPFPVAVKEGVLELSVDYDPKNLNLFGYIKNTFKLDDNGLIMPAFVRLEPETWKYVSPTKSYTLKFEGDPFEKPMGRVRHDRVGNDDGYYSYEEAPRSRDGESAQYLRLLTRTKEGFLTENSRLIFDAWGQPRFERLLSTGERSHQDYPQYHYLPDDDKK